MRTLRRRQSVLRRTIRLRVSCVHATCNGLSNVRVPGANGRITRHYLSYPKETSGNHDHFFNGNGTSLVWCLAIYMKGVRFIGRSFTKLQHGVDTFLIRCQHIVGKIYHVRQNHRRLRRENRVPNILRVIRRRREDGRRGRAMNRQRKTIRPRPSQNRGRRSTRRSSGDLFSDIVKGTNLYRFRIVPTTHLGYAASELHTIPFRSGYFGGPRPLGMLRRELRGKLLYILTCATRHN